MKYLLVVLSSFLLCSGTALAAGADSWAGPHVGIRVGANHSELDNAGAANALTLGVEFGWNIVINHRFVADPQIFYEWNQDKNRQACYTGRRCTSTRLGSRVYGLGLILGWPVGANRNLMPYIRFDGSRLQMSGDADGSGWVSWGLGAGLEWRVSRHTGLVFQYSYAKYGGGVDDWKNSSFTVGFNFHF
ncbi:MAG: porin family protein [Gammaproteobacteria bacterium]